eukprot:g75598.t1
MKTCIIQPFQGNTLIKIARIFRSSRNAPRPKLFCSKGSSGPQRPRPRVAPVARSSLLPAMMPYILPVRESASGAFLKNAREYVVGAVVEARSPLIGKTIEEAGLRRLQGLFLFEIQRAAQWTVQAINREATENKTPEKNTRDEEKMPPVDDLPILTKSPSVDYDVTEKSVLAAPDPKTKIEQGDLLFFSGDTGTVDNLWQFPGLVPASEVDVDRFVVESGVPDQTTEISTEPSPNSFGFARLGSLRSVKSMHESLKKSISRKALLRIARVSPKKHLVEAVISTRSALSGKTVRESKFRATFGAAVLAIHRHGERVNQRLGDVVLQAGDNLLLEAHGDEFEKKFGSDYHYFAVATIVGESSRKPSRNYFVMFLATAVLAVAFAIPTVVKDRWTFFMTGLLASYVYWGLGLTDPEAARAAVPTSTMVMFAASIGLSYAMENSGLARAISYNLISVFEPLGNLGLLYGMYFCVAVLNPFVSNQATVALMYPIAYQASKNSGLSIYCVIFMLMMAGSADFATPIGYITNLMVYSIGGYKFSDYVYMGIPMQIITCIVAVQVCYAVFSRLTRIPGNHQCQNENGLPCSLVVLPRVLAVLVLPRLLAATGLKVLGMDREPHRHSTAHKRPPRHSNAPREPANEFKPLVGTPSSYWMVAAVVFAIVLDFINK